MVSDGSSDTFRQFITVSSVARVDHHRELFPAHTRDHPVFTDHLLNLPATTELIGSTVLPAAGILAVVLGAAEVAIAIGLVFGLLTRIAGLGLVLVAGGALAFVLWGNWTPFEAGKPGFVGALELLLVAVGVLFMLVGGGGWSVDHGFRARRAEAKAA